MIFTIKSQVFRKCFLSPVSPLLPLLRVGGVFGVVAVRQTLFICNTGDNKLITNISVIIDNLSGDRRTRLRVRAGNPRKKKTKTEVCVFFVQIF